MLLVRLLTELVGTFLFLTVILAAPTNPVAIAVALLAAIYFGGPISGGHFNPAVTVMMFADGKLSVASCAAYVSAQLAGGLLALLWWRTAAATRTELAAGRV